MATERELAAALEAGLPGIPVRWGWKALETAEQPPSLPMITLQRTSASITVNRDMCSGERPNVDTMIQVHTWQAQYEDARALNERVRDIIIDAGGWEWQGETDAYEPSFRGWRIAGEYLGIDMAWE